MTASPVVHPPAAQRVAGRADLIRFVVTAGLLAGALTLPWNIHFGLGITDTNGWLFAVLVVATVALLAGLMAVDIGVPGGIEPSIRARLQRVLSVPYLALIVSFALVAVATSVRDAGSGAVSAGLGPGVWAATAAGLLAVELPGDSAAARLRRARLCRAAGWLSVALATLAGLVTLYFRTRFTLPGIVGPAAVANLTTVVAAILYTAVALSPVLIAAWWIVSGTPVRRLATVLLAVSAVIAGALVWLLPAGRDLDAFHGIAQSTGTAGVGYEGYLVWAAVAGSVGTATVRSLSAKNPFGRWWRTVRPCLLLIAVWCGGTAVLRITDVVLAAVLDLPAPPYNSTALMAFDLITAMVAVWVFLNSAERTAPRTVMTVLLGVLSALTVCRLIVGLALVPKVQPLNPGSVNHVFGNHFSQQITSTFDVTLAVLAVVLLGGVLILGARAGRQARNRPSTPVVTTAPRLPAAGEARIRRIGVTAGSTGALNEQV